MKIKRIFLESLKGNVTKKANSEGNVFEVYVKYMNFDDADWIELAQGES
jgi:hypothetical protein